MLAEETDASELQYMRGDWGVQDGQDNSKALY